MSYTNYMASAAISFPRFPEHMEPHELAFTLSKSGKLKQLKQLLNHRSKEERKRIISIKYNGATSLIMACRNGHIDVVSYLVDQCGANIEQTGLVNFEGENIEGAPPLWCASAAGHLKIVKYLVSEGANVNSTTKSNSTALRAACFDGHLEIVKFLVENNADIEIANRHGHTCLMIACYKGHLAIAKYLINKGADLNRKSVKGNTALHDCAECGSLDIMKLLLSHNATMAPDAYQMTPLLAAAVTGHAQIVEYLLTRNECDTVEKINALELLGATYVDKKHDMLSAYNYWKTALERRNQASRKALQDKQPDIYTKAVAIKTNPIEAYDYANEFMNEQDLDELISDPDDVRMQALLIRERILGPLHPDTTYYIRYRGAVYADCGNFRKCILLWLYALETQQKSLEPLHPMIQSSFLSFTELFQYMQKQLAPSTNTSTSNNFVRNENEPENSNMLNMHHMYTSTVLKILKKAVDEVKRGLIILKQTHKYSNNSDSTNNSATTSENVQSSSSSLDLKESKSNAKQSKQESENKLLETPPSTPSVDMSSNKSDSSTTRTTSNTQCTSNQTTTSTNNFDMAHFDRTLVVIVHFLVVVAESLKHCSPEEMFKIKKLVYELIKLNPKNSKNSSLIHLAVSRDSSSIIKNHTLSSFPSAQVLKLLLECGSDPNSTDGDENTPLHLAAANRISALSANSSQSSPSLSNTVNSERDKLICLLLNAGSHLDTANAQNKTASDLYKGGKMYQVVNPINYISLQCLAAKVIRKHKIEYQTHLTPKLANFVSMH